MKINEPIGDPIYAPFFIRIALGALFIMAGLGKLNDIPGFIRIVQEYKIPFFPPHIAVVYGTLLPYVEIGAGALMILGFWTTLSALMTSLMLLSFVIANGALAGPIAHRVLDKDVILLAASISLLFSGSGAFSIDRFRKSA